MGHGLRGQMAHVRRLWIHPSWRRAGPPTGGNLPSFPASTDIFVAQFNSNANIFALMGNSNGTFSPVVTYTTQSTPNGLMSADLNGDGIPDLAVANYGAGTVGVFLGNANGTFQAMQTFGTTTQPYAVAAGDVNGDGILDLVVSSYNNDGATAGARSVSVLLGNGNGTFKAFTSYNGGAWTTSIVLGATTTSGNLDILVTNSLTAAVGLLLGNGNGTFKAVTARTVPAFPQKLGLNQFTTSGNLDLVMGCNVSAGNSVFTTMLGNGNGTFKAFSTMATSSYPYGTAVADLNNDGKLDVVLSASLSTAVTAFLGNGNGTFQAGQTYANAGSKPWSITLADTNKDNIPDVVLGNDNSAQVNILLGNGNGTFQVSQTYSMGSPNQLRSIVASAIAFKVTAPATATAATAFAFTVTAENFNSITITNYKGTVHFTSSDGSGTLPANATLTSGVGTFTATLATAGSQTITASDTTNVSLIGHSGTITVSGQFGNNFLLFPYIAPQNKNAFFFFS